MPLFDEDLLGLSDKQADILDAPFAGPPVAPAPSDPTKTAEPGRSFIDPAATRKAIYDRTLSQLSALPPISNQKYTLSLGRVAYHDPEDFSLKEQKQAILEGRTLTRRLRGTWSLTDNATGREVASKTSTLAHVPHYNNRGVFTLNGSQYSLASQLRLKPGVFTRLKENGELDSHINVLPGQGVSHHVHLDPESGVFKLNISQANYPLFTVLKAMGAKDKDLQEAWGDLYYANAQKDDAGALNKLHAKLVRGQDKAQDDVGRKQQVAEALLKMPLDPEVNQQTLGKPYANVSPEVYIDATKKLLALSRGEIDPDDRDHLAYMTVHGPEDLISERVLKDQSELRRALWRSTMKGDLSAMPAGVFSKSMINAITKSGLGQPLEQINPSMVIEQMGRISRMGVGGVPSVDSIPEESRSVQPSHLGYIDFISTPENQRAGMDSRVANTALKGSDGRIYSKFLDVKSGKSEYLHPGQLMKATIAFPGELDKGKPHVAAMQNGRTTFVPREEVTHVLPNMEDAFGPISNLVPMKSAVKGQRLAMGARMSCSGATVIYVLRRGGDFYRGPIKDYVWSEGDRSPSVDKETGVVEWKPVRDKITHENVLRMYRVGLKSGRHVEATNDHSFVTLGEDGSLVKIATQDLKPGAPIPYLGHMRVPGGLTPIDWAVPAGNKHNAHPGRSLSLDFDLGWVHGMYAAEGNVVSNGGRVTGVQFAALTPELRELLVAFLNRYDVPAAPRSGRDDEQDDRVLVNWKQFGLKIGEEFGRGAYNKKLPAWVFTAPEEYRCGLVAGYLAGDGIFARHRAQVAVSGGSRSVTLRDTLCDLLATLGIDATRSEGLVDTGPNDTTVTQYSFRVRSDHVHKLPLTMQPRKDKLLQTCRWSGKRASDWLPMYPTLKRQLVAVTARNTSSRSSVYADRMTKTRAAELLRHVADPRMHRWAKSDVRWDEVESVVEVDASLHPLVYDLDMEDNVFACQGGVFVHNTTQALPLIGAEAPHVQSGVPGDGDESYEEKYGVHMGAVRADQGGWVKSVTPDAVEVELPDKSIKTYELAVHEPSNRKTGLNQTAVVQPGQQLQPGQLIARSNYTDDRGATALGRNVRVGMLPGFGENSNYEDAWVISRSAADKFRSEHYYQHEAADEDGLSLGKQTFVSAFPGKFARAVLDNFGPDGVIKPGTEVKPGDPLILAVKQREANRAQVYRGHGPSYVDKSETWDHHDPGVVTDAVRTKDGVRVVVRTESSAEVGDKLCLSGDHDVLTANRGWVPIPEVTCDDLVACIKDGRPAFMRPEATHRYDVGGRMYEIHSKNVSLLVTRHHRMYVMPEGDTRFKLLPCESIVGKRVHYATGLINVNRLPIDDDARITAFDRYHWPVYCLTVPGEVFYVRRRGKKVWTGNSNRMGGKGLIGAIVPDHLMPQDEEGRPTELLFNPAGVISRTNPAAAFEFALGKIAEKTGKPYKIKDFDKIDDLAQFTLDEMEKHGVKDFGSVTDPRTGRKINGVTTGNAFFMKLHHSAACFDDQTEVLTSTGWARWADVTPDARLACRVDGRLEFHEPEALHVYDYDGEMLHVAAPRVDYCVTPDHRMYGLLLDGPVDGFSGMPTGDYEFIAAEAIGERPIRYLTALPPYHGEPLFDGAHPEVPEILIAEMLGCDMPRTTHIFSLESREAAEQASLLAHFLGYTVRTYRENAALHEALGEAFDDTDAYVVVVSPVQFGDVTLHAKRERISYKGKVYCATVPGGLVFTRRNGKAMWSGNSKIQGRGTGGYSAEGQPARGVGTTSAKRLALMSMNALLSSGATNVIRDGLLVRGQANPTYWLQFMSGHTPPTPEVPHVHQKFFNQLKGAGINVVREGTKFKVKALRNQDVDDLAEGRVIRNSDTVSWKEGLAPIKGGLFDEALTGGHGGKKWSSISLHEPMPSPVFEEPIRRLLNLTKQQYRDVLSGRHPLGDSTGPAAIKDALSRIDVDKAIEVAKADVASGKKTSRDAAIRRLGYLKSAKKDGIHPKDWIWDKVPVLPPIFRPVSVMQSNKKPLVADVNVLYKELMDADSNLKDVSGKIDDVGPERLAVYDALKAVTGLDDSIHPKTVEQGVKGLLAEIHGNSPKFGTMQRKLLSAPVDLVGRAVIVPNPDLDIDSVGVPESHAWEVYKPFIVRRLVRRGMKHGRAVEEVAQRTQHARDSLLDEMKTRPVILDRAPVLHRYGVMAFWPKLVKGDSIHLTPLVTAGYGADFDGDQMNYQVPASDEAVKDAVEKMLPSKNLFATSNFQVHQTPTREYAAGLWLATRDHKDDDRKPHVFKTKKDAIHAYKNGEIDVDHPVHILND